MSKISLVDRVTQQMDKLSVGEKALADFMLKNVEDIPFLSALEVADAASTSNASVTRLSQSLGYRGYVELQKTLRLELKKAYSPSGPQRGEQGFIADYWRAEERGIVMAKQLSEELLQKISEEMAGSRQIWLGGAQTMRPVAAYAEYYLNLFRGGVRMLVEDIRTRPDGVLDVGSGDVAVLFTVRRYAIATSLLGDALLDRGATLIVITDDGAPRLARRGHFVLRVPAPTAASTPSASIFISVVQLLALLVAAKVGNTRADAAEHYVAKYDAYEY